MSFNYYTEQEIQHVGIICQDLKRLWQFKRTGVVFKRAMLQLDQNEQRDERILHYPEQTYLTSPVWAEIWACNSHLEIETLFGKWFDMASNNPLLKLLPAGTAQTAAPQNQSDSHRQPAASLPLPLYHSPAPQWPMSYPSPSPTRDTMPSFIAMPSTGSESDCSSMEKRSPPEFTEVNQPKSSQVSAAGMSAAQKSVLMRAAMEASKRVSGQRQIALVTLEGISGNRFCSVQYYSTSNISRSEFWRARVPPSHQILKFQTDAEAALAELLEDSPIQVFLVIPEHFWSGEHMFAEYAVRVTPVKTGLLSEAQGSALIKAAMEAHALVDGQRQIALVTVEGSSDSLFCSTKYYCSSTVPQSGFWKARIPRGCLALQFQTDAEAHRSTPPQVFIIMRKDLWLDNAMSGTFDAYDATLKAYLPKQVAHGGDNTAPAPVKERLSSREKQDIVDAALDARDGVKRQEIAVVKVNCGERGRDFCVIKYHRSSRLLQREFWAEKVNVSEEVLLKFQTNRDARNGEPICVFIVMPKNFWTDSSLFDRYDVRVEPFDISKLEVGLPKPQAAASAARDPHKVSVLARLGPPVGESRKRKERDEDSAQVLADRKDHRNGALSDMEISSDEEERNKRLQTALNKRDNSRMQGKPGNPAMAAARIAASAIAAAAADCAKMPRTGRSPTKQRNLGNFSGKHM